MNPSRFIQMVGQAGFQKLVAQAQSIQLQKSDVLPLSSPYADTLYWISVGGVQIKIASELGRETFVADLRPGDFFGGKSSFGDATETVFFAVANEPCLALQISAEVFHTVSRQHPEVWMELLAQSSQWSATFAARIQQIHLLSVQQRVLHFLRTERRGTRCTETVEGLVLKIARQDLADALGCTREMVSKALQALKRSGEIQLQGRAIILPHGF